MARGKGPIASRGEYINHINAVRFRVLGSGTLEIKLMSEGNGVDSAVEEQTLEPLTMSSSTNVQPLRLANFRQQRAQLQLKTSSINEVFKITRIVVYSKPIATSYPGN